jgi:hypothetical protein
MLREAKKMRKELIAALEDARTRVAELETQNLDHKLEIDSLKASPVVSDEVECANYHIFPADLAMFKEKHASKCEELDVLSVEVAELKSRSALKNLEHAHYVDRLQDENDVLRKLMGWLSGHEP